MAQAFRSFDEFWPHYLREHASPTTRAFHYAGVGFGLLLAITGIIVFWSVWSLAVMTLGLIVGYAFSWIGHIFFEKNRPATFGNPLWSLWGDMRMLRLWLMGRLTPELEKAGIS